MEIARTLQPRRSGEERFRPVSRLMKSCPRDAVIHYMRLRKRRAYGATRRKPPIRCAPLAAVLPHPPKRFFFFSQAGKKPPQKKIFPLRICFERWACRL